MPLPQDACIELSEAGMRLDSVLLWLPPQSACDALAEAACAIGVLSHSLSPQGTCNALVEAACDLEASFFRSHLRVHAMRCPAGTRLISRLPQCRSRCSNCAASSATASASTVCTHAQWP